jgi:ammonium transporter Rh
MLNATLAGGVVVGASCDIICQSAYCFFLGMIAGGISAVGYLKAAETYREKITLHDTCGIQYLHGIPGVIGGIASAAAVGLADVYYMNDYAIEQAFPLVKMKGCAYGEDVFKCRTL